MLLLRQRCVQCISVAPHELDHLKGGIPPCWNMLACWTFSSSELAGLCLKCPTTLQHLASAPSKPPSQSDITTVVCTTWEHRANARMAVSPCCHHIRSTVCSNGADFVNYHPLISDVEKLPGARFCKLTPLCFHHT